MTDHDAPFVAPETHGYEFTPEQWDELHELTHGDADTLADLCRTGREASPELTTDQIIDLANDHHDRTYSS